MIGTDAAVLLGLAAATFVGALAQRSTGMGFALLASPFLVLVLGPLQGILVVNVCGALSALLNLTQVRRDVDRKRLRVLAPMGVIGVIPGAIAVAVLPAASLMIAVSTIVLLGLLLTLAMRGRTVPDSPALGVAGGLASRFMNVTAGVGGPGVVIYARATGWEHRGFAATAQVQFMILSIVSLVAKRALTTLSATGWTVLIAALLLGVIAGGRVSRRVDGESAMRIVLAVALAGALMALVRGVLLLV
ncbi:sulfite exporter TauE/SafE family protein [Brachybacterium halotolerans subsp. kimchii]|uniref:sulfite exporter TauE/SafE family protein n=1 Tax=Brachybacterium halotolerans TaxID=2795215 RepID=UPI001E2E34C1|nr:sulfite exporter TauE/SafE family protein [Brachybacterium halotolerans]UEJ81525.1 sulfite exporter TauE/SafE family protein [Brachybacterium halotolerans subsp. kimchii]